MNGTTGKARAARAWGAVRRNLRRGAWAALIVLAVCARADAQAVYSAARVKAAFLYHFTTYVNWPESARSDDVFTIAVLGSDAVAGELAAFLPGHEIQGRPMRVRRVASIDDLNGAEVLYIGRRENRRLARHLEAIGSRPLLVVTDDPNGLQDGAMINFRIVEERVRFEISLNAARQAGLELSSRLLSAAMSVESAGAIMKLWREVAGVSMERAAPP
jgi:hypothetical protein